ncbi:SUMF1/EgtB/PvdO family nonheme iron enzyme [Dendronalium sp. ChiSLP03b]|uniref:SUMF1/EgtB/PvdO family nonheme iron enzyme n=1 Tax=Dendronalium sp. ChiSLP03b TaxID=3075381 RepID=UPI002AD1F090|nr:SUMF1/EgtB/PvdO family nonheme iron enzyme [Dendronalium sp. ChiSLP03b]MDZ8209040.1 SUMF1/EgtB/PvdO family nonheme iron enzyme [Dendronalium sp. ChiSLP03b]
MVRWLKAVIVSLSLPLLFSSNVQAQDCTQVKIRAKIEQFKDDKTLKSAREAVVQCGEFGVPFLAEALSNSNAATRGNTAYALGKIGWSAQKAVPDLVEALSDDDKAVRSNAVRALIAIGRSAQQRANTLSELDLGTAQELEVLKQHMEKALSHLKDNPKEWANQKQEQQELRLTRNGLKTKVVQLQARTLYRSVQWVNKNSWIWLPLVGLGYLGIFAIRPLWLLQLDKVLQSQSVKLPFVNLEVQLQKVLLFKYRPRVLDEWVKKHLDSVQQEFFDKEIVKRDIETYVPLPVTLDGKTLIPLLHNINEDTSTVPAQEAEHKPLQDALQQRMQKNQQFYLLIQGEGGAGKTSLACQIARWGMQGKLANHRLLPVLIDREFQENETLLEVIRKQLQDLTNTGDEEISNEYLKSLLQQRRILVILDRFSEMEKASHDKILFSLAEFPIINALVVTSRLEEELRGMSKFILKPMRVEGERISEFLGEYLKLRARRDRFDDEEFLNACLRLNRMVGQRNITILLAKLYAEQMIATQEETGELPENIPELILSYLNQLTPDVEPEKQIAVHRDAEAVSWKCLEQTYRPTPIPRTAALAFLAEIDPNDSHHTRLNYLEASLKLVQKIEPDKIRITLDPLAEYLAGLYLVNKYKDNIAAWTKLLEDIEQKLENLQVNKGFLLALWDCCEIKKKEFNIPDSIIEQLLYKTDLKPEVIREAQRKQRMKMLVNDLSAPEAEYRARAAADLGAMSKNATAAIPRLRKALENDNEVFKVRIEAAKALKQIGQDIPILIGEIKDGVESIRLVEAPPTEKINLGNGTFLEIVEILGGTFLMGATSKEETSSDREHPQHEVTVASFLMGKYSVTQAQWQAVASLPKVEREIKSDPSGFKGANLPVECVNWYDIQEFFVRICQYTGRKFRLPSEAEWEYACRSGRITPFHFGETISTALANYKGSVIYNNGHKGEYREKTTPVGNFQVTNNFGLYDMHGNVWEWCADSWHENYEGAPLDGSVWQENNNNLPKYVIRGGSWKEPPSSCRSANRGWEYARKGSNTLSFRVVCSY